jgi:GTP-binding protein EngB required for normal cell division
VNAGRYWSSTISKPETRCSPWLILDDARRGPEKEELMLAEYLAAAAIPYGWVLTKCDKIKRTELDRRLRELAAPPQARAVVVTSAETGRGIDDLWRFIEDMLGGGRTKGRRRA